MLIKKILMLQAVKKLGGFGDLVSGIRVSVLKRDKPIRADELIYLINLFILMGFPIHIDTIRNKFYFIVF